MSNLCPTYDRSLIVQKLYIWLQQFYSIYTIAARIGDRDGHPLQ